MKTFMVKANLTIEHLYAIQADTEEEAINYINTRERYKNETDGQIKVLDKVWLGTNTNKVETIEIVWEDQ